MTGTSSLKDEIIEIIGTMSERKLYALRDLLVDDDDTLSEDEKVLLAQCRKDIREHPESFTPWEQVRREV